MAPPAVNLRARILAVMADCPGVVWAPDDMAWYLGTHVLAVRPRFTELTHLGHIERTPCSGQSVFGNRQRTYRLRATPPMSPTTNTIVPRDVKADALRKWRSGHRAWHKGPNRFFDWWLNEGELTCSFCLHFRQPDLYNPCSPCPLRSAENERCHSAWDRLKSTEDGRDFYAIGHEAVCDVLAAIQAVPAKPKGG